MKNLINALSLFTYKYDLDIQQNLSSLKLSVENGYLDFNLIKNELLKAIELDSINWNYIALESRLIPDVGLYSHEEIKDYVCYLIFDFFFPEQCISKKQKEILYSQTEEIFYEMDNEWMNSKDILKKLHENKELHEISHFRLHDLKFKYLTFEWKYDLNKPYQIGFYRLKEENIDSADL